MAKKSSFLVKCALIGGCFLFLASSPKKWCVLKSTDLSLGAHHTRHLEVFGKYVEGFNNGINTAILQAIDIVQAHAMDGGGYFTGKDSVPTESPVYYNLHLFGRPLIEVPRHSSYCSGATYTAFIEALNLLLGERGDELSEERYEALRMQEPDGSRREDLVKFWGYWNADGFGSHYALVQYGKMGEPIAPEDLRPGDFVNISWRSGLGHSVIFLGWAKVKGDKKMLYWSSQRATNGYGDQLVSLKRIKNIKAVRLTKPEGVFSFDPATPVDINIRGDRIGW
ncbi:MAG: hypothetical protein H5U38_04095 [Calditrichaeota bacterium]|nr:hypothetical protein [Calditrichota bacterium]